MEQYELNDAPEQRIFSKVDLTRLWPHAESSADGSRSEEESPDGVKEYLLTHRSIAVPRGFLVDHPVAYERIEFIAACFINSPRCSFSMDLDKWSLQVLEKCFGLQILDCGNGRFRASHHRLLVSAAALGKVELREELWDYEGQIVREFYEAKHVAKCLRAGAEQFLDRCADGNNLIDRWQSRCDLLKARLMTIVAQEYLLMESIAWPKDARCKQTEPFVTFRYRGQPDEVWSGLMAQACEVHGVDSLILRQRLQSSFVFGSNTFNLTSAEKWF